MNIEKIRGKKEIPYPQKDCVYFLTDEKGEIVYIGQSRQKCMISRLSAHGYTKKYNRIFYIECQDKKAMEKTEAKLIIEAQPKYNRRIDDPSVIGFVGITELKRLGFRYGSVARIVEDKKIKTIGIGTNSYFEKRILKFLK